MKRIATLLALSLACGTTHHAKAPQAEEIRDLDQTLRGDTGRVWLTGESAPRPARDLALDAGGVFWRDPQGKGSSQPYAGVREISRRSHLLGFLQGAGIGLLGGGTVGAAIGATGGSDHCGTGTCLTRGGSVALGAVLLGGIGAVLGGLIGGAVGSDQHFILDRQ